MGVSTAWQRWTKKLVRKVWCKLKTVSHWTCCDLFLAQYSQVTAVKLVRENVTIIEEKDTQHLKNARPFYSCRISISIDLEIIKRYYIWNVITHELQYLHTVIHLSNKANIFKLRRRLVSGKQQTIWKQVSCCSLAKRWGMFISMNVWVWMLNGIKTRCTETVTTSFKFADFMRSCWY